MISGGLYLCHGAVMDAYMPSMDDRYADRNPNHLLAAHTIAWAKRAGYRYYNWQGSPPGGGVERFKRSFGSLAFDYEFMTWVTGDPSRFLDANPADLVEEYRWHYVLPYDRVGARAGGLEPENDRRSQRSDVWNLSERDE